MSAAVECPAGSQHGAVCVLPDPPQDLGDCVNIEVRCAACQQIVSVVSWTKAAWIAQQAKRNQTDR